LHQLRCSGSTWLGALVEVLSRQISQTVLYQGAGSRRSREPSGRGSDVAVTPSFVTFPIPVAIGSDSSATSTYGRGGQTLTENTPSESPTDPPTGLLGLRSHHPSSTSQPWSPTLPKPWWAPDAMWATRLRHPNSGVERQLDLQSIASSAYSDRMGNTLRRPLDNPNTTRRHLKCRSSASRASN
jgi:hypothetical protein